MINARLYYGPVGLMKPYRKPRHTLWSRRGGVLKIFEQDKEWSMCYSLGIKTDDSHWLRSVPALRTETVHYSMTEGEARNHIKLMTAVEKIDQWSDINKTVTPRGALRIDDLKALVWWMENMEEDLP